MACRDGAVIRGFWFAAIWASLLLAPPARAGHYALTQNTPTSGSGSVSHTCSNSSSMHYPGGSSSLSDLNFGCATDHGTITYSASETWSFEWVPDEGEDLETDPPVDEYWSAQYGLSILFTYPSGYGTGQASGSLTLSPPSQEGGDTSLPGDLKIVPAVFDPPMSMNQISPWHTTGTDTIYSYPEVTFLLSGASPTGVRFNSRAGN